MKYAHLEGRRYVNLVRCSSDEEADTSPVDQANILNGFGADNLMLHAGGDIVLEGVSGSVPAARTDIDRVIARKRARDDFDVLLVQDFSRFTRGGSDHGGKLKWDLAEAGIEVVFVTQGTTGDPDQDSLIQCIGFYAAQQQAKSLSYAATRGQMSSLEAGNIAHTFRIPYGIDRLYVGADGKKRHRIRNLVDGSQQMLAPDTDTMLATYAKNPKKGAALHYRRQSDEQIVLVPGDPRQVEVVRQIFLRRVRDGWGPYRIAKELNDQGVPSPMGGLWARKSVRDIFNNSVYTGVGIAGRYATGIYYVRGNQAAPKPVQRSICSLATRKKSDRRLRPKEDWKWQPHPLLTDYLGDDLRELVIAMHQKEFSKQWQKSTTNKPLVPKRDKHTDSPYVLKGVLRSKQGGYEMTGRLSGPRNDKRRYYGITRGVSTPKSDSLMSTMIAAEPLERAVLHIVKDVLLDTAHLRDRIAQIIHQQRKALDSDREQIAPLLAEREEIAAQLADALNLGVASRRLMKGKLDQWEAHLVVLESRIAKAQNTLPDSTLDLDAEASNIAARLTKLAESVERLPPASVRKQLGTLITRLEIDLETREVEMDLTVPEEMAFAEHSLCLDGTQPWPSPHQAQRSPSLRIATVWCVGTKGRRGAPPCFECRRATAA